MPLGASSFVPGFVPSSHLSSITLPSGEILEMKPLPSAAVTGPLTLLTKYTSSSGTYSTDSGVFSPTSFTITGGGSCGASATGAGLCSSAGAVAAMGAGGGGADGGG